MIKYMANMLIQYDLGTSGPIKKSLFHFTGGLPKTLHYIAMHSVHVLPNESRQAAVRDLPPMDKKPGFTCKCTLSLKCKHIF